MTYEGVLALAALLVAAYQLAGPATRASLDLFIHKRDLVWALAVSAAGVAATLSVEKGVIKAPGISVVIIQSLAFGLPLAVMLLSYARWRQAKLTGPAAEDLAELLDQATITRSFGEAERVLRLNAESLATFTGGRLEALFSPGRVRAFLHGGSLIHLELLTNGDLADLLGRKHDLIEAITRELLNPAIPRSPLHYDVLLEATASYGRSADPTALTLFRKTYGDATWFTRVLAHNALLTIALEALRSGDLDDRYNGPADAYGADDGLPGRASCPVFRVARCHLLAIRSGIRRDVEADYYVTDLWWLFKEILERSEVRQEVWARPQANSEHPTPFSYLLTKVAYGLEELAGATLAVGSPSVIASSTIPSAQPDTLGLVGPPPPVGEQIALPWSFCVARLLDAKQHVSTFLADSIVRSYLLFALRARFAQHKLFVGGAPAEQKIAVQLAGLLAGQLRERVVSGSEAKRDRLRSIVLDLDMGSQEVRKGQDWLQTNLALS